MTLLFFANGLGAFNALCVLIFLKKKRQEICYSLRKKENYKRLNRTSLNIAGTSNSFGGQISKEITLITPIIRSTTRDNK
jgi:hypothetical protein